MAISNAQLEAWKTLLTLCRLTPQENVVLVEQGRVTMPGVL